MDNSPSMSIEGAEQLTTTTAAVDFSPLVGPDNTPGNTTETENSVGVARQPISPRRSPRKHKSSAEVENRKEEEGYETDDCPCFDAVLREGEQDFDEDDVLPSNIPAIRASDSPLPTLVGTFVGIENSKLDSMKTKELKIEHGQLLIPLFLLVPIVLLVTRQIPKFRQLLHDQ